MIKRTLGFVESATALAQRGIGTNALHTAGAGGSSPAFLKTVIMPDGRVIQISAGNPKD